MSRVRPIVAPAIVVALALGAGACGSEPSQPEQRPARTVDPRAIERHDSLVDVQLRAMGQAAAAGDRLGVDQAWQRLERLARSDPAPPRTSTAADPYERAIDEFRFKRAPLFVQQLSTREGSHRAYAGVDRRAFCLLSVDARLEAVAGAYRPLDRRLRGDGVNDLELVVVGLTETVPKLDEALAIGRDGVARMTPRGRRC